MFDLLKNIGDFLFNTVSSVIEFFVSLVKGLISLITQLPKIISLVTDIVSLHYLPTIFITFISLSVIIYIVYLVLGRDPGD